LILEEARIEDVTIDEASEIALYAPPLTVEVACETNEDITLDTRLSTEGTAEDRLD
jgi:hypothetical protein